MFTMQDVKDGMIIYKQEGSKRIVICDGKKYIHPELKETYNITNLFKTMESEPIDSVVKITYGNETVYERYLTLEEAIKSNMPFRYFKSVLLRDNVTDALLDMRDIVGDALFFIQIKRHVFATFEKEK